MRLSTRPAAMRDEARAEAGGGADGEGGRGARGEYPPPEREHWRQAACVFPTPLCVSAGQTVTKVSNVL